MLAEDNAESSEDSLQVRNGNPEGVRATPAWVPLTSVSRGPGMAQDAREGDIGQEPGVGIFVSSLEQPAMV